jgi:hypothetical protein
MNSAPPVARILAWFAHRQTLCVYPGCRQAKVDGDYCSDYCREIDLEDQAHG